MSIPSIRAAGGAFSNERMQQHLNKHLPLQAVQWLVMLFDAIQVFDDVYDGDPVTQDDASKCLWHTLVAMPQNPFFAANSAALLPAVATAIMKWHAANKAENEFRHDAQSYMWRAGYYDVVLLCVTLCNGPEYAQKHAEDILRIYGENLPDYLGEFNA